MTPATVQSLGSLVKPRVAGLLCLTGASALLAAGGTEPAAVRAFCTANRFLAVRFAAWAADGLPGRSPAAGPPATAAVAALYA